MESLSWKQIAGFRLARHSLARRRPVSEMLDVAAEICGLHAQLLSSAELTLWARTDGLKAGDVSRALWEDRSLVKIWAVRGTLHLVPASEYWIWQAALSSYGHYLKPSWLKYFGATRDDLSAMIRAMAKSLEGNLLTRQELAEAVGQATSPELGDKLLESWGALLKPACFQGKLCFGPNAGRNVRFTSPAWWLGGREEVDPVAAGDHITRRFLAANGPATREDYARWWAISPAQALSRIRRLGDDVVEVEVEGSRCWMLSGDVDEASSAGPPGTVNLVPAFDQYVVGATRHAEAVMPGPCKGRIYRPQGWISPVLLVDGRMDGIWSHERKGDRLVVTVEPFAGLGDAAAAKAEQEARRLAEFLECGRCHFSVGSATRGSSTPRR